MLQFNKSQETNTVAIWPDVAVTASIASGQVWLDFTQVYDNYTGSSGVVGDLLNSPGVNGVQYLVFSVSGSALPAYSGQYIVNIYDLIEGAGLIWGTTDILWTNANVTWANATANTAGSLISTDRAYVSGSNEVTIVQYASPNEDGSYITYNG